MKPLKWVVREKGNFTFITGLSNFKLIYIGKFLELKLSYHSNHRQPENLINLLLLTRKIKWSQADLNR